MCPIRESPWESNLQGLSDPVRYLMCYQGFDVVNYTNDFIGFGMPDVVQRVYDCLYNILGTLGLTVSQKKLVPPLTHVPCLGIIIDTVDTSISIPEENCSKSNKQ